MGEKQPNVRLASWFARSGWSKGELARQVNRRARALGVNHVSTDTSRVRRWLDGEQPRDPIPRILSELFTERFGCMISSEDLGLREPGAPFSGSAVDLPWTSAQTVELLSEFSRSDLILDQRAFAGVSLVLCEGPALTGPLQRWLAPVTSASLPAAPTGSGAMAAGGFARLRRSSVSAVEIEQLEQTIRVFRDWDAQCGGGLRRKAVVGQLHEVTELLEGNLGAPGARRLFAITAELALLAGWMAYDVDAQPVAQKYFVLALHAAKQAKDRPLGANILAAMGRQMIHLGRSDDALAIVHLAKYGSGDRATVTTLAMLHALEGRAYAGLGHVQRCRRAIGAAEELFAERDPQQDPSWIAWFDQAELAAHNGSSYRDLAHRYPEFAAQAESLLGHAVKLSAANVRYVRTHALNLLGLASVYVLQDKPDLACETAGDALTLAGRIRSARVNGRVRATLASAQERFPNVATVRDLAARVAAELPDIVRF